MTKSITSQTDGRLNTQSGSNRYIFILNISENNLWMQIQIVISRKEQIIKQIKYE